MDPSTTTTTTDRPTGPTGPTPLPTPPFVDVPGLPNLRDAGGYRLAADPARMVRRGVLYRSSEPSRLTDAGAAYLTDGLGIGTVYDLRSRAEIDRDAAAGAGRRVREWAGADRVFAPVFAQEDYSPEAIALRFSSFAREGTEVRSLTAWLWSMCILLLLLLLLLLRCGERGVKRRGQKCAFGWEWCVRLD